MADWFAENAPQTAAPAAGGDWFKANAPGAAPKPYDAATRGAKAKGTPEGLPDTFMGTISKDFAAIPEGIYNAATHPIDTVKGAVHQLVNLPHDVMYDISQGNWGKLAAKFGELAVPALSSEKGLAAAGTVGAAAKDAAAGAASGTADVVAGIASHPLTRETIGSIPGAGPLANALLKKAALASKLVKAITGDTAPASTEATVKGIHYPAGDYPGGKPTPAVKGASPAPAVAADFSPPRPGPSPATAPPETPAPVYGQPMLRVPPPAEAPARVAQPPAAYQAPPQPGPLPPNVEQPFPTYGQPQYRVPPPPEPVIPAVPKMGMAEAENDMANTPPVKADQPGRSQYYPDGTKKSPEVINAETTQFNRTAKAGKMAQGLSDDGVSLAQAKKMQETPGAWKEFAKSKGLTWTAGEHEETIAETLDQLAAQEKAAKASAVGTGEAPAKTEAPVAVAAPPKIADATVQTPAPNALQAAVLRNGKVIARSKAKLTPQSSASIAQQLKDAMEESGTIPKLAAK